MLGARFDKFAIAAERVAVEQIFGVHVQSEHAGFHRGFVTRCFLLRIRTNSNCLAPARRSFAYSLRVQCGIVVVRFLLVCVRWVFINTQVGIAEARVAISEDCPVDIDHLPVACTPLRRIHFEVGFLRRRLFRFSILRLLWIEIEHRSTDGSIKRTETFAERDRFVCTLQGASAGRWQRLHTDLALGTC